MLSRAVEVVAGQATQVRWDHPAKDPVVVTFEGERGRF